MSRRISTLVSEELYQRLQRNFEWGERNKVVHRVLEWLCEKIERHGRDALVLILREEDFTELANLKGGPNGNH